MELEAIDAAILEVKEAILSIDALGLELSQEMEWEATHS
jgi:hypothetical protein